MSKIVSIALLLSVNFALAASQVETRAEELLSRRGAVDGTSNGLDEESAEELDGLLNQLGAVKSAELLKAHKSKTNVTEREVLGSKIEVAAPHPKAHNKNVHSLVKKNPKMRPSEASKKMPSKLPEKKSSTEPVVKSDDEKPIKNLPADEMPTVQEPRIMNENPIIKKDGEKDERDLIYNPAPTDQGILVPGLSLERDSARIVTRTISPKDSVTVKMCIASGLSIVLDDSIKTDLQRVLLDDKIYFDAQEFDNKRGVYVRLIKQIPSGSFWESAIRLVRKDNDQTYLVNLIGVPCPEGPYSFPKMLYLKDKPDMLTNATQINTPEDTIISLSEGFSRKPLHKLTVYDMLANSGSNWVVLGIELQTENEDAKIKKENIDLIALDNLQVNRIEGKFEILDIPSKKATEMKERPTYRVKLLLNLDKTYMMKNRFIYLIYLNRTTKHYQYLRIDMALFFKSLRDRGFDL